MGKVGTQPLHHISKFSLITVDHLCMFLNLQNNVVSSTKKNETRGIFDLQSFAVNMNQPEKLHYRDQFDLMIPHAVLPAPGFPTFVLGKKGLACLFGSIWTRICWSLVE